MPFYASPGTYLVEVSGGIPQIGPVGTAVPPSRCGRWFATVLVRVARWATRTAHRLDPDATPREGWLRTLRRNRSGQPHGYPRGQHGAVAGARGVGSAGAGDPDDRAAIDPFSTAELVRVLRESMNRARPDGLDALPDDRQGGGV